MDCTRSHLPGHQVTRRTNSEYPICLCDVRFDGLFQATKLFGTLPVLPVLPVLFPGWLTADMWSAQGGLRPVQV